MNAMKKGWVRLEKFGANNGENSEMRSKKLEHVIPVHPGTERIGRGKKVDFLV